MEPPRMLPPGGDSQAGSRTTRTGGGVLPPTSAPQRSSQLPEALVASHGDEVARWALASLDADGAEKLLSSLSRETATALMDVPATDVHMLTQVYGASTLDKAAPAMRGHRLATELELVGPAIAKKFVTQAADSGKFAKLVRHANNMEALRPTLEHATALEKDSLIVDSQVMISVRKLVEGSPWESLSSTEKIMINWLRSRARLAELTGDPPTRDVTSIVGDHDLRAANVAFGEVGAELSAGGIELAIPRADPRYTNLVDEMSKPPVVGRNSGVADRAIVADAVFARRLASR